MSSITIGSGLISLIPILPAGSGLIRRQMMRRDLPLDKSSSGRRTG